MSIYNICDIRGNDDYWDGFNTDDLEDPTYRDHKKVVQESELSPSVMVRQVVVPQKKPLSVMGRSVQDAFYNLYLHIFHRSACIELKEMMKKEYNNQFAPEEGEVVDLNKRIINYKAIYRERETAIDENSKSFGNDFKEKMQKLFGKIAWAETKTDMSLPDSKLQSSIRNDHVIVNDEIFDEISPSVMVRSVQDAFYNLYLHIFHRSTCIELKEIMKDLYPNDQFMSAKGEVVDLNKRIINYNAIYRGRDAVEDDIVNLKQEIINYGSIFHITAIMKEDICGQVRDDFREIMQKLFGEAVLKK